MKVVVISRRWLDGGPRLEPPLEIGEPPTHAVFTHPDAGWEFACTLQSVDVLRRVAGEFRHLLYGEDAQMRQRVVLLSEGGHSTAYHGQTPMLLIAWLRVLVGSAVLAHGLPCACSVYGAHEVFV